MRVTKGDSAAISAKLDALGASKWVRVRAAGASVHVESIAGKFDYVRFRRVDATSWRLEELAPTDGKLTWRPVRGTRAARLPTVLARWDDRRLVKQDIRWDAAEARREEVEKAVRRESAAALSRDPAPLCALAKALTRKDADGLERELRLAVEQPDAYFKRFRRRLAQRCVTAHYDTFCTTLPFLALVNGLKARGALVEFDWKEENDSVVRQLRLLLRTLDADVSFDSCSPRLHTNAFVEAAGRACAASGIRLAILDIGADCIPLVAYESGRHREVLGSARRCEKLGFGRVRVLG